MKSKNISSTSSLEYLPSSFALTSNSQDQVLLPHKGSLPSLAQTGATLKKSQHTSSHPYSSFIDHHRNNEDLLENFSDTIGASETAFVSSARKKILAAQDFEKMGMVKIESEESFSTSEKSESSRSDKTTLPSLSSSSRESDSNLDSSFASGLSTSLSSFSTGGFAVTQQDLKAVGDVLGTSYEPGHPVRRRGKVSKLRETFLQCAEIDPSISKTSILSKKKEKIEKALEKILLKKIERKKELNPNSRALLPPIHSVLN